MPEQKTKVVIATTDNYVKSTSYGVTWYLLVSKGTKFGEAVRHGDKVVLTEKLAEETLTWEVPVGQYEKCYEEVQQIELTNKARHVLRLLPEEYKDYYLAKDKDGAVSLYENKPAYDETAEWWGAPGEEIDFSIYNDYFTNITHETPPQKVWGLI